MSIPEKDAEKVTQITATLTLIFSSTPGNRSPYTNYYECDGPDGRRFTNSSKAELLGILRRRYGKVRLAVTDMREPVNRP